MDWKKAGRHLHDTAGSLDRTKLEQERRRVERGTWIRIPRPDALDCQSSQCSSVSGHRSAWQRKQRSKSEDLLDQKPHNTMCVGISQYYIKLRRARFQRYPWPLGKMPLALLRFDIDLDTVLSESTLAADRA